ncbi:hypothetical protein [Streptacidiphilus sp. ASG 303]|uniref:hypothetical protein n=1 Tax=Streptomycetaceae TaxID=2062 RepID=UPI001E3544A4|nr:hypothetical protein [Streptacidiphilus sp. ASG 303]MCD0480862.1 hypothetical protein [Streptacidiphilus sp. ASG 303]
MAAPLVNPHGHLIGSRTRDEVERVLARADAEAGSGRRRRFLQGVSAACAWALGRTPAGPVTGAPAGPDGPGVGAMTAEVDAAVVQLEVAGAALPGGARDFVQGAHDALAWLCGYSDDRP